MSKKSVVQSAFIALLLLSGSGVSTAQVAMTTGSSSASLEGFGQFIPRPQKKTKIDYDVWDSILEEMVLYTGPSARIRMSRPAPVTGSRFSRGHTSPYRLEGNRIPYSQMKTEFKELITGYREDIERVGSQLDIAKLSRNEQLAYWMNLHNVVMVEQLAMEYPVRQPSDLKIGKPRVLLHDAKIINIKGTALSLRDIREKIVYPNWKNPKVIYGFYLGDIGSPSIQNTAFNAKNISDVLDRSASEFVNSLRGFHVKSNNRQYISELYTDVAKFYFPNFDADVKQHLAKFMRDDVRSQMISNTSFRTDRYETIIADMTAGLGSFTSISQLETTSRNSISRTVSPTREFMQELIKKRESLERQGLVGNGTVIIEDIETVDPDSIVIPDIE